MNITRDFFDHLSSLGVQVNPYSFKCEIFSPIHKCNRILQQINETEKNISQIETMSKKSSSFNDHHLKFSNASTNIKKCLIDIEGEIKTFQDKDMVTVQKTLSKIEQVIIKNAFDIINSRASDLTVKFQKFLAKQAELIKKLEEVIEIWLKEFLAPKPLQEPLLLQEVSVHKIKISDQVIYLEPTIFEAREFWYNQFHQLLHGSC